MAKATSCLILALWAGLAPAALGQTKGKPMPEAAGDALGYDLLGNPGLGEGLDAWTKAQTQVAAFTRVCAYDRAGVGKSGPGPKPRTSQQMVTEVRAMLKQAQIDGPYVLVGHSFDAGTSARTVPSGARSISVPPFPANVPCGPSPGTCPESAPAGSVGRSVE